MPSTKLKYYYSNDVSDLEELMARLMKEAWTRDRVEFGCHLYRRSAIARYLMSAKPDHLHRGLFKSGRLHLEWLRHAPEDQKLTSRFDPVVDAIACLDHGGLQEIHTRSPTRYDPDYEYPEDVLYAHLLMGMTLGHPEDELRGHLDAYDAIIHGEYDGRREIMAALLDHDESAFGQSFEDFLDDWTRKYRKAREDESLPDEILETERHVCIEGLVLVRLAQAHGLKVARTYRLVPKGPSYAVPPYKDDAWRMPRG